MDDIDDTDVPETGAVFTYGLSRFGDNEPGKFWVRNDKTQQIACGEEHTVVVVESGRTFSFGKNDWGQLGIGSSSPVHTKPVCIKALKSFGEKGRLVACGRNHTIIATESGSLYGIGSNGDRQLGVESDADIVPTPIIIQKNRDYVMLSAGGEMTAVLLSSGDVFTWGSNSEGQCGIGSLDIDPVTSPTRVRLPGKATCISCGYYHAAAVMDNGRLFTWGESDGGKLGLGPNVSFSQESPQEVKVHEPMRWVSCGNNHTVAVAASGRLYTWGEGPSGQLGLGQDEDQASDPREVKIPNQRVKFKLAEAGDSHTVAITEDGRLFSFGDARHGKLGLFAPDQDSPYIWRPTEVLRFPDSGLSVHTVSCGGCHTVLLGGWKEARGDEIVPASVSSVHATPQPSVRRRNRGRSMNGEADVDSSRRLNQSLPPLRRPSNKDISDEGFGSQSSTRNGDRVLSDASDNEDPKTNAGKTSFDNLLMKSKFDNMLSLEDDEDTNIVPPPRRSLLAKKESTSSSSPYVYDDQKKKSTSQFSKRPSLRDDDNDNDEGNENDRRSNKKYSGGRVEEDEMIKESTKAKRRGRSGMFSKRSTLQDDDDDDDYDYDEKDEANERLKPPTASEKRLSKSSEHVPSQDHGEQVVNYDTNINAAHSEPDTRKVRVGCGGGGGRNDDGSEKSKSCIIL